MEPQDLGLAGMAVVILGGVATSLIDLIKPKQDKSVKVLETIHTDLQELLRMHHDPNSSFSTVDVSKTLQRIEKDITVLKERSS